jgi:hypothetical protein
MHRRPAKEFMQTSKFWLIGLCLFLIVLLTCCSGTEQPPTPLPSATAAATLAQQNLTSGTAAPSNALEISAEDNGKTFRYTVTTRFSVTLDGTAYPKDQLACSPEGVIGEISNVPPAKPPLYTARFEAIQAGSCSLKDGSFSVTILVTQ